MAVKNKAVVVFIPVGVIAVDFDDLGDETPARPAFEMHDDIYGISDICFDRVGAIYHEHWSNIFTLFGCNLSDFDRDQAMFAPARTQLSAGSSEGEQTVTVPLRSRENLHLDKTNLLSRLVEIWGEVPLRFLQHLDLKNGVYGFVGMDDRTLFPLIRPGSIVQIDQDQRKVLTRWENEHDRPIYFVELRGEFLCTWCELREGYLWSVPHPLSKCQVRRFAHPREAEIVGRVIGVSMRLVEAQP